MKPDAEPVPDGHRIRLRGPWEYERLGSAESGRVVFPSTWAAFGGPAGTVRFTRRFGRPAGLTDERIWLELTADGEVLVSLNGRPLGLFGRAMSSVDVTDGLALRNRLVLDLQPESDADADGTPIVEASLLIRPV